MKNEYKQRLTENNNIGIKSNISVATLLKLPQNHLSSTKNQIKLRMDLLLFSIFLLIIINDKIFSVNATVIDSEKKGRGKNLMY